MILHLLLITLCSLATISAVLAWKLPAFAEVPKGPGSAPQPRHWFGGMSLALIMVAIFVHAFFATMTPALAIPCFAMAMVFGLLGTVMLFVPSLRNVYGWPMHPIAFCGALALIIMAAQTPALLVAG